MVFFLDNFGLAAIYPILAPLFLNVNWGFFTSSGPSQELQLGLLIAIFPFFQFFGSPLIGRFSDYIGRRKTLLITVSGTGLGYLMTALAISFKLLPLLFISRAWTGFFAGNATLCIAATADASPAPHGEIHASGERGRNVSILGAIGGLSFCMAIVLGQLLSAPGAHHQIHPSAAFWMTALLSLMNLGVIWCWFQDNRSFPQVRETKKWSAIFGHGFSNLVMGLRSKELQDAYIVYFFFIMTWVTSIQFFAAYLISNFAVAPSFLTSVFVGVGLLWFLSNSLFSRFYAAKADAQTLKWTMLLLSLFLLGVGVAQNPFFAAACFLAAVILGALGWAQSLTIVSLCAPETMQGTMLGVNQSFGAIASMVGPALGGLLALKNSHAIYLLTTSTAILGSWMASRIRHIDYRK